MLSTKILSSKQGYCILPCHCHFIPVPLSKPSKVSLIFLFKISNSEGVYVLTENLELTQVKLQK